MQTLQLDMSANVFVRMLFVDFSSASKLVCNFKLSTSLFSWFNGLPDQMTSESQHGTPDTMNHAYHKAVVCA